MPRPSLQRFWDLLGSGRALPGPRTTGDPPSANGASSLHLRWELPPRAAPLRQVAVTLEVVAPPEVDRLYFWALQADFADPSGRPAGGAHLGLQWHPQHPGSTAVNWGGYDATGRELDGSGSDLPSALRNVNTRDMAWSPGRPYRLVIARHDDGAGTVWRGSVTGPDGAVTVVRDLYPAADRIVGVVMWSEVFARCDHPSVGVRWSDPSAVTLEGDPVAPGRLSVNYQSHAQGGCANTDSRVDGAGVVQWTNAPRTTPQGAVLAVPDPR
ncbi:hypothetical protein [Dermatobacter hominis]|uniref:hypothetical protein n=1 Tax=Dermatobacter hominis TaxID=2884263 RepID=UPI001D11EADE|nr:hypothetical protein [Dermatobacter hominis]UDY37799.1 hypothetical protein LH044_09715 [Dermatobacter hominis]